MAKSPKQAPKRQVIEALVLAFSSSELHEIVGTDALRSVLSVEYLDIVESGSFDLQQVWELLEQQPGFTPEAAKPPMCVFKGWEDRLGMKVILPDTLEAMSPKERALLAARCRVPAAELSRLLPTESAKKAAREEPEAPSREQETSSARDALAKPWVLVAASALALVCFAFVAFSVVKSCRGPQWDSVAAAEFAGELPIDKAQKMGTQVGATLTDASWLSLPEELRRSQLEAALRRLEKKHIDIDVLFLRDSHGNIRASAQVYDDGRKIRIRFQ